MNWHICLLSLVNTMKRGRSLEVIGSASQQDESDALLITQVRSRAKKARADRGDTQRGKNVSTVVGSVTTSIDVLNVKNIIKNVKKRVFFLANKKR